MVAMGGWGICAHRVNAQVWALVSRPPRMIPATSACSRSPDSGLPAQKPRCPRENFLHTSLLCNIVMIMQGYTGKYTSQKPTAWYRRQEVLGLTPGSVSLPIRQVSLRWIPRGLWNVTIKIVDRASMCTAASVPLDNFNMDGAGNRNLTQFRVGQAVKIGKGLIWLQ